MSRLLKLVGFSALLLASTASAQYQAPLVYSKTGYAPVAAPNVVAYSVNGQPYYQRAAAPTPQGSYDKAAHYPVYAPGPVTYHRYQAPAQVQYRTQQVVRTPAQIPVQYQQQQVIATERPVVYEAAVLPVVKNVDGAQQQYYAQSQTMAQQQMMQPSQHAQTAQSAASYYAQ